MKSSARLVTKCNYHHLPHPSGKDELSESCRAPDVRLLGYSPVASVQSERGIRRPGCAAEPHREWVISGVNGGEGSKRTRSSSPQKLEPKVTAIVEEGALL